MIVFLRPLLNFLPIISIADRIEAGEKFYKKRLYLDRPLTLSGNIKVKDCELIFKEYWTPCVYVTDSATSYFECTVIVPDAKPKLLVA